MPLTTTGIHYRTAGAGGVVVFLHGVTLDGRMWRDQVAALDDRYRCISVDRRGHGGSQALSSGYDPIGDLEAVLGDAGVASCCVVGHSLGGWDAIRLAHRRSDLVASLVLVASWFPLPPMEWAPPVEIARRRGVHAGRAAWLGDPLFASAVTNPTVRARLAEMVESNDLGLWISGIPSAEPAVDPAELAMTVRVPTLVVVGTSDLPGFIDVAAWLGANMAGAAPPSAALVEGAGHMLPMEAPVDFNRILERFLAEHTTPVERADQ
jgi:pimeloyl-ACP methyl ester carboxylesterase